MQSSIEKIFLIDDDEDDAIVFRMALKEIDPGLVLYYKNSCHNITEAIAGIQPNLIFLDINMPRINGIDCLETIKESTGLFAVPVIIYSSSELPGDLVAAYEKGAVLYFRKPYAIAHLIASLSNILQLDWKNPAAIKAQFYREGKTSTI